MSQLVFIFNSIRPMGNEWRGNATLMIVLLEKLEWRVAGVGPAETVAGKGTVGANLATLFSLETEQARFIAPSIICLLYTSPSPRD